MNFMNETIDFIRNTDIKERKKYGQFFTSKKIRDVLMGFLPKNDKPIILEPSCGTGEFIKSIYEYYPNAVVEAFDKHIKPLNVVKSIFPNIKIEMKDMLFFDEKDKYDFVIGNPPYFEFSPSNEIISRYGDIINGRLNIYSLFIKIGIDALKNNGYLAYVIPPSINNGNYFNKIRDYIIRNTNIEIIKIIDNSNLFDGANQKVMILVLKKCKNNGNYIFRRNNITIFSTDVCRLNKEFSGKVSLIEAGFKVKTGNIVWNQNKDKLSNNKNDILLIWSHNINNGIVFSDKKPQYIKVDDFNTNEAIVVNRITGSGKNAKIRAAIIRNRKWVAENHVNVIYKDSNCNIPLEKIYLQIISKSTTEIIKNITGNTQISKNELEKLIPFEV